MLLIDAAAEFERAEEEGGAVVMEPALLEVVVADVEDEVTEEVASVILATLCCEPAA